jgi:hypothetical protein
MKCENTGKECEMTTTEELAFCAQCGNTKIFKNRMITTAQETTFKIGTLKVVTHQPTDIN